MKEYDISILILTYNPQWSKLKGTILSALKQKNISFEIVVSDDGSQNSFQSKLVDLFYEYNFEDYILVESNTNTGTVSNYKRGLDKATGSYIRAISPGDYIYSENCLKEWLEYMNATKAKVCFGNAEYYNDDDDIRVIRHVSAPRAQYLYNNWPSLARKEYLVLDDMALGAAYLSDRKLVEKYINEINGKIKLGEDYIYTLMTYDGIQLKHYDKTVLWYEYGHGVSTSNSNFFSEIMKKDWIEMHHILLNRNPISGFEKRFHREIYLYEKFKGNKLLYFIIKILCTPEILFWRCMNILARRYTETIEINQFFKDINLE